MWLVVLVTCSSRILFHVHGNYENYEMSEFSHSVAKITETPVISCNKKPATYLIQLPHSILFLPYTQVIYLYFNGRSFI